LIKKYYSTAKYITTRNLVYDKVIHKIQYLRDKYPQVANRSNEVTNEISKLLKERRIIPSRLPNRTRLTYVRYTDDWIVGVYGLIDLEIKDKIVMFLSKELELELS